MTQVTLTRRKVEIVDCDDSPYEFWEVLMKSDPSKKTLGGRVRSIFKPWTTVHVPEHLAEAFPAGMERRKNQPLWEYKLVDGVVYSLRPTACISYS